jgi:hypothetical protein
MATAVAVATVSSTLSYLTVGCEARRADLALCAAFALWHVVGVRR